MTVIYGSEQNLGILLFYLLNKWTSLPYGYAYRCQCQGNTDPWKVGIFCLLSD